MSDHIIIFGSQIKRSTWEDVSEDVRKHMASEALDALLSSGKSSKDIYAEIARTVVEENKHASTKA